MDESKYSIYIDIKRILFPNTIPTPNGLSIDLLTPQSPRNDP